MGNLSEFYNKKASAFVRIWGFQYSIANALQYYTYALQTRWSIVLNTLSHQHILVCTLIVVLRVCISGPVHTHLRYKFTLKQCLVRIYIFKCHFDVIVRQLQNIYNMLSLTICYAPTCGCMINYINMCIYLYIYIYVYICIYVSSVLWNAFGFVNNVQYFTRNTQTYIRICI